MDGPAISIQEHLDRTARNTGPVHGAAWNRTETLLRDVQRMLNVQQGKSHSIGLFDHVTLLPNRVSFNEQFDGLVKPGASQCLYLLTLADARHFNDLLRALGHAYAEDFVRAGAERLAGLLSADIRIFHISVLSFAFVADGAMNDRIPSIVAGIVSAFRRSLIVQNIPIDSKTGVGVIPLDGVREPSELLRATLAAAQDSRLTHDGWAWYNSKSDAAHQRAFRILADLPAAIEARDELSLEFQPRIAMSDSACVSAEALIRWTHPRMGQISPMEFISLAEATALITPLTQWVFERALTAVARWQSSFRGLKISVNVSPKNLEEPDFAARLIDIARRLSVDPRVVELEFTEGVLGGNWHFMMTQLEALRAVGFEIAIDDFGSGYSNMSYLGKIPAKYLKIDQGFVRTLDTEAKNQVLVRAIIEMAHALDYSVVAEGIETLGAFDMLRSWNCDEGQGYYMSKPLPDLVFHDWITDWRGRLA